MKITGRTIVSRLPLRRPRAAFLTALLLALACTLASGQSRFYHRLASQADDPKALRTGSAEARLGLKFQPQDFKPPQVNHAVLPNGITLDYFAEPNIPLVTILVRLRVGSVNDPAGKVGAAELAAEVIKNGGTPTLPGDQLDRTIEARGAQLSVETDREETWFRLSLLKEDLAWGLGILTDLLTHPAFPEAKLEEARSRTLVGLAERFDTPMEIAQAVYPQLIYGKGNPWGWTQTEQTVKAVTVADLKAVFERYYTSGNMKLGLCGDVAWADAQRLAADAFGRLAKQPAPAFALPEAPVVEKARVYYVPRPATQNVVYFGHEGVGRFDPLKFPIKVFNNVLSGGFTSRLFKEIRSDRGLAYEVFGRIGEGTARGLYSSIALTKAESTGQVLGLMRKIDEDLMSVKPSWQEVDLARTSDINSFVFFFDTPEKIVHQKIYLDGFGYPPDYLATYTDKLKAVTPDQVKTVADTRLHPDRVVILVVGQADPALLAEMKKIATITEISDEELHSKWM